MTPFLWAEMFSIWAFRSVAEHTNSWYNRRARIATVCLAKVKMMEVNGIEVRINKEVRDYQEGIFFGLTMRQFLCALGAVTVALAVYFFLGPALGGSDVGWACVLAAAPFALCGFYRYNSMTFEQFILAVIRSELLYPKRLVFKSDHLYTKALENATIKEALKLD